MRLTNEPTFNSKESDEDLYAYVAAKTDGQQRRANATSAATIDRDPIGQLRLRESASVLR